MNIKSPYSILKEGNSYFVFDGGNGSIMEIDELLKDMILYESEKDIHNIDSRTIKNQLSNKYNIDDILEYYDQLKEQNKDGFLLNKENIYDIYSLKSKQTGFKSLCLNISETCNLRCKYCFAGGGNYGYKESIMSFDIIEKCIDYWYNNLDKKSKDYFITFFGGEPFLNIPGIKHAIDYLDKLFGEDKGKLNYIVTTNGTTITEEILNIIKENNFEISVSIDGLQFIHDNNRPYRDGSRSYSKVLEGYTKLKEVCENISVQITLPKKDIKYLSNSVEELWNLGIKNVYSNIVFDKDIEYDYFHYDLYRREVENLSLKTYENLVKGNDLVYGNLYDEIKKIHNKDFVANCFMWNNKAAIFASNGDMYRCYRATGNKEYLLGHVEHAVQCDFALEKDKVEKCSNCYMQLFCGDGCPYENKVYTGDMNLPAEEWCAKNKIIFDESLKLYLKIFSRNPQLFNSIFKNNENVKVSTYE